MEAYKSLKTFYLLRCVSLARVEGANSPKVTDAVQDRELLKLAVARRLHHGRLDKGSEALESAFLRARVIREWEGGTAPI